MKKLLVLSFLFGMFLCVNAEDKNEEKKLNKDVTTEISVEGSVTVYMIKIIGNGNIVTSTKKNGYYDSDNETLTVDGKQYDVYYNSYYDDEVPFNNKNKACFRYVAGGKYYFND